MFGNIIVKLYLKRLEKLGFMHGNNFSLEKGANIDRAFCHMISCGDNVTITKGVYIIAHDASMKKFIGKTKTGKVVIGNDVFIGAHSVIHPGVTIGDRVVIATNSSVVCNIPSGEVWGGVPAKFIMKTDSFLEKHKKNIEDQTEDSFRYID